MKLFIAFMKRMVVRFVGIRVTLKGRNWSMDEKLCHIRYCRLVSRHESLLVTFSGGEYRLNFVDHRFRPQKGIRIERIDSQFISSDFLLWLSAYIGEDFVDPFKGIDTRFVQQRGDFAIDAKALQRFLNTASRVQGKKWPKWKHELLETSLLYFSGAIRLGVDYMPVSLGLFALSLECLGNFCYGKRDKNFTLGKRYFERMLTTSLSKPKKDADKKKKVRDFEKRMAADIGLLIRMRNTLYGHSLLHLEEDRKELVKALREWAVRYGQPKKFADVSFHAARLRSDIVRESFGLYKLGLRLNRLFLFLAMRHSTKIPFATHDFRMVGDFRNGEESEFQDVRTTHYFSDFS